MLFGDSAAHKKFIALDDFMSTTTIGDFEEDKRAGRLADRAERKPSDFFRLRDDGRTALLNYMGIEP